jgi:hypothetical protein
MIAMPSTIKVYQSLRNNSKFASLKSNQQLSNFHHVMNKFLLTRFRHKSIQPWKNWDKFSLQFKNLRKKHRAFSKLSISFLYHHHSLMKFTHYIKNPSMLRTYGNVRKNGTIFYYKSETNTTRISTANNWKPNGNISLKKITSYSKAFPIIKCSEPTWTKLTNFRTF